MSVYLDWAATALPDEAIYREALETALRFPGNPSAQHAMGAEAKKLSRRGPRPVRRRSGVSRGPAFLYFRRLRIQQHSPPFPPDRQESGENHRHGAGALLPFPAPEYFEETGCGHQDHQTGQPGG